MSFHNSPKYQIPELIEALKAHGLDHDTPSQLADAFRIGWFAKDAHTAKVLGDVEPVGWVEDAGSSYLYSEAKLAIGEKLYPAHTVAALKSRADALAARVAELEKDAGRLDYLQRGSTVELLPPFPGFSFRIGGLHAAVHADIRSAIDSAALAAKGQA